MTAGDGDRPYHVRLTAHAQRSLTKIPPRVVEPLLAFMFGSLAEAPKTRGKPLRDELAGYWSARRGDYRIVYTIADTQLLIHIVEVGHRAHVYRTR